MSKTKGSHSYSDSKELGYRLLKEGKYTEAEPMFRMLVDCRLHVLGYDSTETASAFQMLAFVLEKQGKHEEALNKYESALKAYNAAHGGEGHPDADVIYAAMVKICRMTKQFDQALAKSKRLLKIRILKLGTAHPKTALSYHNVAICFHDQGMHKEALDILNKALKVQQDAGDSDTHGIAGIYTTMAKILVELRRFVKAMQVYQRVLRHQVMVLGQCSPAVALTYRNVALAYQCQSKTVEAWKACVEALQIYSKLMDDKDPKAAWRKQCQKVSDGNPQVIRSEAKKTLQIAQVLEKQMAKTMLPSIAKPSATLRSSTEPTIGDASKPIIIIDDSSDTENESLPSHESNASVVAQSRKNAATAAAEATYDCSNAPQKRKLDHESEQMGDSRITKKQRVGPLESTTETNAVTPETDTDGNESTTTLTRVMQKLIDKLRQIEAFEEKGLFNLTQEEITMLSSKQDILNRLRALQKNIRAASAMPSRKATTNKVTSATATKASTQTSTTTTVTATSTKGTMATPADGNTSDANDSNDVAQKQALDKKLHQIEAVESKGLFNLTQEQRNKLNSKQDALSQMAALAMLGMSESAPKKSETQQQAPK